jgi:uncharacterized protein DUF1918
MSGTGGAAVGDVLGIAASGSSGAGATRRGTIVGLAGSAGSDVYRVRWADGRETMLAASAALTVSRGRVRQPDGQPGDSSMCR